MIILEYINLSCQLYKNCITLTSSCVYSLLHCCPSLCVDVLNFYFNFECQTHETHWRNWKTKQAWIVGVNSNKWQWETLCNVMQIIINIINFHMIHRMRLAFCFPKIIWPTWNTSEYELIRTCQVNIISLPYMVTAEKLN